MSPREEADQKRAAQNAETRAALIEEIEFLIHCDVGEAAILSAIGYAGKPLALQRRLMRADRADLIPRIFEWQAMIQEQQHPRGRAA